MADLPGSRRAGLTTAVSAVTVVLLLALGLAGLVRRLDLQHGSRRLRGTLATRRTGTRRDGALLSYLKTVNDRYAREVRTTLGDRPAKGTDDRVAGPALDSIQRLLDGAITGHRAEADRAAARQRVVLRNVTWMLPLVFLIALSSLVVVWRMLRREHRRLAALAARNDRRARTDGLTGLANRDGLEAAVARLEDADSALCLMVLDLDGFKPVNDTHGHAAGDDVLCQVAGRLRAAVRRASWHGSVATSSPSCWPTATNR